MQQVRPLVGRLSRIDMASLAGMPETTRKPTFPLSSTLNPLKSLSVPINNLMLSSCYVKYGVLVLNQEDNTMKPQEHKRGRITDEGEVVFQYVVMKTPMIEIAKMYGVRRQTVFYCLHRQGVDTTKETNGRVLVTCEWCKKDFLRKRNQFRKNNHNFCTEGCYYAWLDRETGRGRPYKEQRMGRIQARRIVAEHFDLKPGNVVHHEDRDQTNNALDNLMVFANGGEHTRYHRGYMAEPIWQGSLVKKRNN